MNQVFAKLIYGKAEDTCESRSVVSNSSGPHGLYRPEHWSREPFLSLGDLPNPGIKPRSPTLQANSLPAEPPGKPKNTGAGILALLQGIFPTQEWGLQHCGWTCYQLSCQGSPEDTKKH